MNHGRYEILERLGEGESAVVYRTRDLAQAGREVILKVLKRRSEGGEARFRREFEALAALSHPNVLSVIDFGVSEGQLYYSAEYHAGQRTLREAVKADAPSLEARINLAVTLLRALEYVHTRGLVHRDLKAENVLVDAEGVLRLSDFGLVGVAEGQAAGSPDTIAPEVLRRLRVDRRADLYSFGVVFYELLTGQLPYEGETARAVARKHLEDRPQPPTLLAPEVTPKLEAVVLKLLEKEPSDRYPSANAVIAALGEACAKPFAFETSQTKQAYVLSGRFLGRDREIDWLLEGFQRATGPLSWTRDPREFDRRARFATARAPSPRGNRRRGGDRRASRTDASENPPALMVLLRGASGVGKTRLTEELRRSCQLEGAVFLRGQCRKHLARGYEPFVSIFKEAAQLPGAGADHPELGWAVSQLLGDAPVAKGVERLRLIDALAEFLIAQSTRQPLVLCLENLQWARGETLDLLLHVYRTLVAIIAGAETPEERPQLFLVGTYRPEELRGPELGDALKQLSRDRFFEELCLGPLELDDTGELIRSMLGVPAVPRAFTERVMEATSGNPLFVELLMEELVDLGVVDRTRGLWRLDPDRLRAVDVPGQVDELIRRRLERLPERETLEWLAILDRDAERSMLARIAGRPADVIGRELEELCRARLVERAGRRFSIAHAPVRDQIYAAIEERASRHAQAAGALEAAHTLGEGVTPGELAHHLLEAGAGLQAMRWARKAAEKATAVGARERACELYTRALRAADDHLALHQDDAPRVRELSEEKLATLRALVPLLGEDDKLTEARSLTLESLRLAGDLGDEQGEVSALAHLGSLNAALKESDDAKRFFFEALKRAERIEYGKGIGTSLLGLGDLTLEEGRLGEALEYLERSLAFQEDLGDGQQISSYLRGLANTLRRQGKLEEAIAYCERALEHDREGGNRQSQAETLELLADLHFIRGDYERAAETTELAIATAELEDDKAAVARCLLALGSSQEKLGQRGEARRRLGEALALTRRLGLSEELAQVLNSVGWLHHQAGDYEEALTAFNEATTIWNTRGDRHGYALGLINLADCYGRRGELVRAGACCDAATRIAWEISSRSAELEAAWGRARVYRAAGELERARELLDKTVLKAREQKQTRLEAMALADQARLLAGDGEGSRALRAARRSRALAREQGDPVVTTRVTLRSAEVDLLRGALAPAIDAFRLRTTWLRGAQDLALTMEAELATGVALTHLGDLDGAKAALDATLAEAETRGLKPLTARTRLAQGRLLLERALLRGGYRLGRVLVAPAELGEARSCFEAALVEGEGMKDVAHMATLGMARVALLEGQRGLAEETVRGVLAECEGRISRAAALLLAELALADDAEQVLVRVEDALGGSPWTQIHAALIKAHAAERAGLRLEARQALDEGAQAMATMKRGLDAADRRLLERTALGAALATALDKAKAETTARPSDLVADANPEESSGTSRADLFERLDRARVMGFLRASREVNDQVTGDAQLRLLLDRALALFGARRGLLVKIGPQGEQAIKKGRLAPGKDLPQSEWKTSSSIVDHVAQTGEVLVLPDASEHLELGERPSVVDLALKSLLAVPLRLRGRTVYVMVLEDRTTSERFSEGDRELAEAFCSLSACALERTRLRSELERKEAELKTRAHEAQRLEVALEAVKSEQALELDAVKSALKGREYELGVQSSYANLVGRSEPMRAVFKLLDKIARSDVPVLIHGESGTGKELVARAVHFNGPRKDKPFLSVNVAALPESLLEAELFGYVKGSFTGAASDKAGLFEAADGGTLFLDEVGDMPLTMQTKLLRVLQEGEVRPIGSRKPTKIDVRVVSASNKVLRTLVEEGRFRTDLFYRLNVVGVQLPPLRERKEDIPLLVDHLLDKIAERSGEKRKSLDRKVVDHLLHHDWPGNVRELENELRRLVALSGMRITERDLSPHLRQQPSGRVELSVAADETKTLKERMELIERRLLVEALKAFANNKTRTAKHLGLSRYGFLKKLDKYRLRER